MLKMSERELNQKDVLPKFKAFAKIIYLALFQSDIRKAFNKAIESIDFDNLRMDEADKYHCLIRVDYDFDGRTSEDRMKEYSQIHKDGYPPLV